MYALFDLDGVLLDTEGQYTVFWRKVGERFFPNDSEFAMRVKGRVLTDIFKLYFPHEADQAYLRQALSDFEHSMRYPAVAGAPQFVAALRTGGSKTAVVTSSDRTKMQNVFRALPNFRSDFDAILMAEDFKHAKPAPDCYLQAAQTLGARPEECVVFEDSENGLKAARAAGAKVVGLSTTLPRARVEALADVVIPDFANLTPAALEARLATCAK